MSRKRKKAGESDVVARDPEINEAIPEDILAEGSGPVQAVAHVAIPTDDQEPDPPVQTKRKSKKFRAEADDEAVRAAVADLRKVTEPQKREVKTAAEEPVRKGKRAKTVEPVEAAAEAPAEAEAPARRKHKRAKTVDQSVETVEAIEAVETPSEDAPAPSRKHKRAKTVDQSVETVEAVEVVETPSEESPAPSRKHKRAKTVDQSVEAAEAEATQAPGKRGKRAKAVEADLVEGELVNAEAGEVEASDPVVEASSEADQIEASGDGAEAELEVEASGDAVVEASEVEASGDPAEASDAVEARAEAAVDDAPVATESGLEASGEAGEAVAGEEGEEGVASLPTSAAALDAGGLKQLVEALVFASDKPMTVQKLRQLTRVSDIPRLEQALFDLAEDYADRGIVLQQVSGGYQFRTRTQWSPWVQQLIAGRPVRLTRAQLETLAIVAYRQPITRPEIDEIRGVDSSATLKLLMDRQLVRILGKKEEVGRPMLYGTTKEFLDFFSLGDLRELPTLREYSELTPESRQVITDELGDLPEGDDGSGQGGAGPMGEGGMGGDPSPEGEDLGAAPAEPTAADLIAKYVAELDAESVREELAERAEREARLEEDERMVFEVLDEDPSDARSAATTGATLDASDSDVEISGESASPAVIAEDASALADAILEINPESTRPPAGDASTPEAVLAAAHLANDAAELEDAILDAPAITDELAFDLSDLSDPSTASERSEESPWTEIHAGTLAELDPFALPEVEAVEATDTSVPAALAEVGDAFVGESILDVMSAAPGELKGETIPASLVEAAAEAPVDEFQDEPDDEMRDDHGDDVVQAELASAMKVEEVFAEGSGGLVGGGPALFATPHVELDEWPGGSGGVAARASMDPRPHRDDDEASIRTGTVDPEAELDVEAVPDPVE